MRGLWLAVELGAYVLAAHLRKHSFTLSVFVFLSPFSRRFQLQKGEDLVVKVSWPLFRSVEEQGAGQAWFSILCVEDTPWLRNGIKAPARWTGVKGHGRNTFGMLELLWARFVGLFMTYAFIEVLLFPHLGINQDILLQGLRGGIGGGLGGELSIREEDRDLWRHFFYFT